jgi:hypothetical protein
LGLACKDVRDLADRKVIKAFMDVTLPSGAVECAVGYRAPFFKRDR